MLFSIKQDNVCHVGMETSMERAVRSIGCRSFVQPRQAKHHRCFSQRPAFSQDISMLQQKQTYGQYLVLGRCVYRHQRSIHTYGFASTLQHAWIRITNPSSTTSTDPKLMCTYFDELGNMTLNSNHSQDLFQQGFVVDNNRSTGMSV